ncbi:MAG TPA: serine/threonine-protein kinase [Gemmataceae bacterium]|nr:serine/threonine-protein kinase [Gemmataceae bacterium]
MAAKPKTEAAHHLDEERLAHALVSRGLVSREEMHQVRSAAGNLAGLEELLERLVEAGFLTASQAQRAQQELPLLLEQQIPGYLLVQKLGQGTMGIVYKARQLSMSRMVAIKVLQPKLAANPDYLERFTHEAHIAARLSHNNIVQAIDVGSAGNLHYFVMEYVEGTTIKQQLQDGKAYAEREALEIIVQIAQALAHAHRRGLIHRDIKPANIILTPEGIAKLADLGLARQTVDDALAETEKGLVFGTPFYISPEQIYGQQDLDARADIYALGATLYHMVTGQPPFPYKDVSTVFKAHVNEELTPPDHLNTALSSGLGEVVEFMMAKDRQERYPNADALILDLECLLNEDSPKLARQRIAAGTLEELTKGEAEEEADAAPRRRSRSPILLFWLLGIVGVFLAASLMVNVILFLRR